MTTSSTVDCTDDAPACLLLTYGAHRLTVTGKSSVAFLTSTLYDDRIISVLLLNLFEENLYRLPLSDITSLLQLFISLFGGCC
jgi:hypothetical protein